MKRTFFCLMGLALLTVASTASAQVIFSDDFDDGAGATRWSTGIAAQEDPGIAVDSVVHYAFDYSVLGAGPATNSAGTTIGVAFESNITDQCPTDAACTDSDEGEGVAIVPLAGLADIPAGDFKLTADVYMYWNFESGSTEYGTIGAFSGGTASPLRFGLDDGDGLAWQFDGDGDSGTDLLRYEDPGAGETGLGGYETIPNGSIPGVETCEPGVDCAGTTPIGPQNQWVEMAITSIGGNVSLSMNGYVMDTFDNTGGGLAGGTIMIGGSDPFNSVNIDNSAGLSNMQVFDNVVLTVVPEPGQPRAVRLRRLELAWRPSTLEIASRTKVLRQIENRRGSSWVFREEPFFVAGCYVSGLSFDGLNATSFLVRPG